MSRYWKYLTRKEKYVCVIGTVAAIINLLGGLASMFFSAITRYEADSMIVDSAKSEIWYSILLSDGLIFATFGFLLLGIGTFFLFLNNPKIILKMRMIDELLAEKIIKGG